MREFDYPAGRRKQIDGHDATQLVQSARAVFMSRLQNHALIAEDGKYAIADGIQAIKVVRGHAAEWGISPDRVVFMGFSAGGMIRELAAVQSDLSARPNYAAPIYGATFPDVPPIPKGVPPIFMETAQDDNLAGPQIVAFYDALKAAGYKPAPAVMAGVCANKVNRATTGLTTFTIGWKHKV